MVIEYQVVLKRLVEIINDPYKNADVTPEIVKEAKETPDVFKKKCAEWAKNHP